MQFTVDTSSRSPIYQQLVQQVREAVARGQLIEDARLPSVRALSRELVVNPNTIARAYLELEREGVLVTRPGIGVFITAPRGDLTKEARRKRLHELLDQYLTEAVHLGFSQADVTQMVSQRLSRFQWGS